MENNKDILKKINSGDPEQLAEAVKEIKENGDLTIASALLQTLIQPDTSHSNTAIVSLLADIKDNDFRGIVIAQLNTTSDANRKAVLLCIIWESSLDYSAYYETFLDILLHDEFIAAFEASTVIENMIHNLTTEQRNTLTTTFATIPEDKKFLIENILSELSATED